jgi:hypothetical protein
MPPERDISHEINFIDPNYLPNYHQPRCPDVLREELVEKIERYTKAGWWVRANVPSAAPLLCVFKKDRRLRTVVDARKRNDNTTKDVTPFPDQDCIRHDVARAKYRSKLDMSDAYEQIRVRDSDVHKTAFSTIFGTFVSKVMQQGDCNAPSTFQRLMTYIFRDYIGRFVHVYLDDIFIYSDSVKEHNEHLQLVFDRLRANTLYLSAKKVDLFSVRMDCLGHIIDDNGIHPDADKLRTIREWPTPRNYHDIQQYLGMVQYLAQFMPDVSTYTSPLSGMTHNGRPFVWSAMHQKCFDMIKHIACKTPILKPVDPRLPDPIWVVCDASARGIGSFYGQGAEWPKARPAGFLSKKFTPAQCNYHTWEHELIAILESLIKWEDKLIGRRITIVTDHKALTFFKTKVHMSDRQTRWWEFLSRFDYDLVYTKGNVNKVADSLSRYYINDEPGDIRPLAEYVNVDARLDPDGNYITESRKAELKAGFPTITVAAAVTRNTAARNNAANNGVNNTGANAPNRGATPEIIKSSTILEDFPELYTNDKLLVKIWTNIAHFENYWRKDSLLCTYNREGKQVVCVPNALWKGRRVPEIVITDAHNVVGHLGADKTLHYIRQWFWWSTMHRDTTEYCKSCGKCQMIKTSNQRPSGLLHSLPIPTRPWESIGIDFMGPLPESDGYDYIMVVICRLTSMLHLIATTTTVKATEVAALYYKEIVRLHGLPESIVSDRDSKFTSKFWEELHRISSSRLLMSTAFHPQTDGATERSIRSINQILRAVVDDDQSNWSQRLPAVEFAINSSINSSSGFAPFELNYGWLPTMITGLIKPTPFKGVKQFAETAKANVLAAHDAIIASRINQTHFANQRRSLEPTMSVGSQAYLSTAKLALPKGRVRKLLPKYIGPYTIIGSNPSKSSYTLDLPPELALRRIHPTFHADKLRPYQPNNDALFPKREAKSFYDFGTDPDAEWIVNEIVAHKRAPHLLFQVEWAYGDYTWEPTQGVNELAALDRYLELHGVSRPEDLPR